MSTQLHDRIILTVAVIGVLGFLYGLCGRRPIVGNWQGYTSYTWRGFQLAIVCAVVLCVNALFRIWT